MHLHLQDLEQMKTIFKKFAEKWFDQVFVFLVCGLAMFAVIAYGLLRSAL